MLSVDDADLSLRLDDPMGLGLAGLAARVAGRLRMGPQTCPIALFDTWQQVCPRYGALLDEVRAAIPYDGGLIRPHTAAQLLWLSARIALTDALCAAGGWAGGDEPALAGVAKWERWASEGPPHWVLTCPDLPHLAGDEQPALWHFECEHTDPLEALEAAWREVCCGE